MWERKTFFFEKILYELTLVAKTFRAALEFINAHLQQRDQVTSVLHTVGFWLMVCGGIRVLTVATK